MVGVPICSAPSGSPSVMIATTLAEWSVSTRTVGERIGDSVTATSTSGLGDLAFWQRVKVNLNLRMMLAECGKRDRQDRRAAG